MDVSDPTDETPWRARVITVADLPSVLLRRPGGSYVEMVGPSSGVTSLLVLRVVLEPNVPHGPLHRHPRRVNTYVGLEGVVHVRTAGGDIDLAPGQAVVIPAGIAHGTSNPRSEPTTFLAIYDGTIDDDFEALK